ncbi:uncharacterized protein LOC128218577 isoform X1 [Mya arenaria]|uniref:uncharacterized protein LOC128218577 isoform X1 n=1 Tax=Mya arenaria TaxID=6604 RepID=UPI0022E67FC5|nr:uncharacterized protein LOC128218577 isoform X1 [Mya arenaria]
MKLKEIAGIAFIMIFVLCSEANELCTRNHTVHDQHTIIIGEACEWNVKASDIFAKLFFTASRQENDAQSCGTGDSIEVREDLPDNTVATLLNINCATPYMVHLMFSLTAKVKVKASGAAIILNMTFKEYRKQSFSVSSKREENCREFLNTKMQTGVRMLSMGEMLKPTEHECIKFNHTILDSNNETIVRGMQTCDNKCSASAFFTFHDTVCYCLDGMQAIVTMAKYCSFPCQENLREMCGGPNYLTIYSSDSITICQFLQTGSDALFTRTYAHCSTQRRNICQDELCGQTFVEHKGAYNFTAKPGIHECNWEISVEFDVAINVSAEMDTQSTLQTCLKHKLSIFTKTPSTADLTDKSLCMTGPIDFFGVGPVFINLNTDSTTSTTVIFRWKTDTTLDSTTTYTKLEDVIENNSPKYIDTTQDQGQDERDRESDKKIALYIPVTISVCLIVVVAIVVAICLRRKRGKKNARKNVDEYNYSYTTTEAQTIHLFNAEQSHPECKLGEYTEVYKPQLPGSAHNVNATGPDANNQEYHTLHQQLEPTYSDPQENVYNETVPPSTDDGQYDVSSVSPLSKKSAHKSHGLTDNVYNTSQSPNDTFGNYDVQYDVSSVSASSNECVKKSKGQTDNVYNTFKSPDDTEYSEANLFIKE